MRANPLEHVVKCPGMYFHPVDLDVAIAFVDGFDLAWNRGLLVGLREWLVVKRDMGNNLGWSALMRELIGAHGERKVTAENPKRSEFVSAMFAALDDFFAERDSPDGLRRIFLKHADWMRRQPWYRPDGNSKSAESRMGAI